MQDSVVEAATDADFCFVMNDDSMRSAHIFRGDLVFIRACSEPQSGRIMAITLDGVPMICWIQITPGGGGICPGGFWRGYCQNSKRSGRHPNHWPCHRDPASL